MSRIAVGGGLVALLALLLLPPARAELRSTDQFGDEFWSHWGDGQAELASYDLVFRRYDTERQGTAIAIFVTETFSNELRVKADPGRHPESDTFPVMKLNLVEDFPTGLYDYNLMTSTFVALSEVNDLPRGTTTKVSHSMQEWCGHAWIQMAFDAEQVDFTLHSYFDGEADQRRSLNAPAGAVSEDAVLLWARGLAGPFLEPGESVSRPMLRGAKALRMEHVGPSFTTVTFQRPAQTTSIDVPAGTFSVEERMVRRDGRTLWRIWVETAPPHRIARWENADGQSAELVAAERIPYWQLNGPSGRESLETLGLSPRPARTP